MGLRALQPRRPRRRTGGRVVALSGLLLAFGLGVGLVGCAGPAGREPIGGLDARLPGTGSASASPASQPALAPPARRPTGEEEGLGGLDMMPGLLDALVPSGCDFENPMSSCQ